MFIQINTNINTECIVNTDKITSIRQYLLENDTYIIEFDNKSCILISKENYHKLIDILNNNKILNNILSMEQVNIKVKKLREDAVIPSYSKEDDACCDITAVDLELKEDGRYIYHTGLAFEIPKGYEMQIRPRSSFTKTECIMQNSPGTLDAGYRGELLVVFRRINSLTKNIISKFRAPYKVGERVAQIIVMPRPEMHFIEVNELNESERGENGFGSTGK